MEYNDSYDNYDAPRRKRFVPSALKGVVSTSGSAASSPNRFRTKSKSKPWQVDRSSWKEQLKVRKTVFDSLAVEEHEDDVVEEKKSADDRDGVRVIPSNDEISIGTTTTAKSADEIMSQTSRSVDQKGGEDHTSQHQHQHQHQPEVTEAASDHDQSQNEGVERDLSRCLVEEDPPPLSKSSSTCEEQAEVEYVGMASELAKTASLLARSAANSSQEAGNAMSRFRTSLQHQQPANVTKPPEEELKWTGSAIQEEDEEDEDDDDEVKLSESKSEELESFDKANDDDEDNDVLELSSIDEDDDGYDQPVEGAAETPINLAGPSWDDSLNPDSEEDEPPSLRSAEARRSSLIIRQTPAGKFEAYTVQSCKSLLLDEAPSSDPLQRARKSLVLSHMAGRVQELYTKHHHSIEAMGTGEARNNKKENGVDVYQQIRTVVFQELSKELGDISTEHHHVVESCLDELERDAKQGASKGSPLSPLSIVQSDEGVLTHEGHGEGGEVEISPTAEGNSKANEESKETDDIGLTASEDTTVPEEDEVSTCSTVKAQRQPEASENEQLAPTEEPGNVTEDAYESTATSTVHEAPADLGSDADVRNSPTVTEVRTESIDEGDHQGVKDLEPATVDTAAVECTKTSTVVEINTNVDSADSPVEANEKEPLAGDATTTKDPDVAVQNDEKPFEEALNNEASLETVTSQPLSQNPEQVKADVPVEESEGPVSEIIAPAEGRSEVTSAATKPEVSVDDAGHGERSVMATDVPEDQECATGQGEPNDETLNDVNLGGQALLESGDQAEFDAPVKEQIASVGSTPKEKEESTNLASVPVSEDAEASSPAPPSLELALAALDENMVQGSNHDPSSSVVDNQCEELTKDSLLAVADEEKSAGKTDEKTQEELPKEQELEEMEVGKSKKGKKRESLKGKRWKDRLQAKKGLKHQDSQSELSIENGRDANDEVTSPVSTGSKINEEKNALIVDEVVPPPKLDDSDTPIKESAVPIQVKEIENSEMISPQPPGISEENQAMIADEVVPPPRLEDIDTKTKESPIETQVKEIEESEIVSPQPPALVSSPIAEQKAVTGFESLPSPPSSASQKSILDIEDDDALKQAVGKPKKKRESLKGKKWKERLGRRRSSIAASDAKADSGDNPAVATSAVETDGLVSPTSSEGKSKKWKDRLAKKRTSKEEVEKVTSQGDRVEEDSLEKDNNAPNQKLLQGLPVLPKGEEELNQKPEQGSPPTTLEEESGKKPEQAITSSKDEDNQSKKPQPASSPTVLEEEPSKKSEQENPASKDEGDSSKKPEQLALEMKSFETLPTGNKESGVKAHNLAVGKPTVEEPPQASKAQSNENSTKVNALRDQLKSSFMAFDALLDPTTAVNKDDESIYTEVTINTGLPSSGMTPQNIQDAAPGGGEAEAEAGDESFMEITVGESPATKSRHEGKTRQDQLNVESSLHMKNLLSSRMFADDFGTNPLRFDDHCEHATHATVEVRSDFDDDMTQITFDQSFMGRGFDGNEAGGKQRDEEDTYGFHDAIEDQQDSVPSFTNLPNTSAHSTSSQHSSGKQNSRGSGSGSSVVSERSKQRIAEVLRKDIWNRDTNVVEAAILELGKEAGAGPSRRANIVRFGGVMAIIRAMDMNPSHEQIQVAACDTLVKMALDTDTQGAICEVGGVSAIVGAMKEHTNQIELQAAACAALASITRPRDASEARDYSLADVDDAVQSLLVAMNRYKDHVGIQAKAFKALANLCVQNQDRLLDFSKVGGIITMTTALQQPWESLQEQHEAVSSLSVLLRCLVDLQRKKQEASKSEAEPALLDSELKEGVTQSCSVSVTNSTDGAEPKDETKESRKDDTSQNSFLDAQEDASQKSGAGPSPSIGNDKEKEAPVDNGSSLTCDTGPEREECIIQ